ncbi:hypothetical protein D3C81_428200 [compost metagenome]
MEKQLVPIKRFSLYGILSKVKKKKVDVVVIEFNEDYHRELQFAKIEIASAHSRLNFARTDQEIDIAIEELSIAERKLDLLIKRAKIDRGIPFADKVPVGTVGK